MKNQDSIDRIIQVNDVNIGSNIAKLRKSLKIKQTEMVAKLQINGWIFLCIRTTELKKAHKIRLFLFCMPAAIFLIAI